MLFNKMCHFIKRGVLSVQDCVASGWYVTFWITLLLPLHACHPGQFIKLRLLLLLLLLLQYLLLLLPLPIPCTFFVRSCL